MTAGSPARMHDMGVHPRERLTDDEKRAVRAEAIRRALSRPSGLHGSRAAVSLRGATPPERVKGRTSRAMVVSTVVHAAVIAWLVFHTTHDAQMGSLTEIEWLEPGDPGAASGGPVARVTAPRPVEGVRVTHASDEHFRREERTADIEPTPQSDRALSDKLNERLAALESRGPSATVTQAASMGLPSGAWGAPADLHSTGDGGGRMSLKRGGGGGGSAPALSLSHGTSLAPAPAIAAAGLPTSMQESAPAAPSRHDASTSRSLAGANLIGPVADRRILHYTAPIYPEWAKHDGVEGAVTLYFVVRADGSVKENILVQRTAGFEDFDESARTALRTWRFAPLSREETGEQWGTITFHFRLDAR